MPTVLLSNVPVDVRGVLNDDARERGVSVNAVAVGIVAARFGVPFDGTSAGYQPLDVDGHDKLILRMPDRLRKKVKVHAARTGGTIRSVILQAIDDHYESERHFKTGAT